MGKKSAPSQTTTSAPWAAQQPYLQELFGGASNWMSGQQGIPNAMNFNDWAAQNGGVPNRANFTTQQPGANRFSTTTTFDDAGFNQAMSDMQQNYGNYQTGFTPTPGADYSQSVAPVAGFDPNQTAAMEGMLGYAGGAGQDAVRAAQGAWGQALDPMGNPIMQGYAGQLPGTQDFLSSMMNQGGGQQVGSPQIGFQGQAPQIGFQGQAPQIGFNADRPQIDFQASGPQSSFQATTPDVGFQGAVTPSPNDALQQMMSATPNMDVYGPLMDQIANKGAQTFKEQIMPGLRSEAMGMGQYGQGKHQQATGLAAGRMGEAVTNAQAQLAQSAASEALNQRSQGTSLASSLFAGNQANQLQAGLGQAGLGRDIQGINAGIAGQNLGANVSTQNLMGGLAGQQGGLDMSMNNLMGGLAGQQGGLDMSMQNLMGGLAGQQGGIDMNMQSLLGGLAGQQGQLDLGGMSLNEAINSRIGSQGLQAASTMGNQAGNFFNPLMSGMNNAMNNASGMYNLGTSPYDTMMGVGGIQQGMDQAQNNYGANLWNAENMGPMNDLMNFSAMINGMGGGYGTTTGPAQQTSPLMGALGGASMGAGIGGMFAGASEGSTMGPWGALGGGLLGLLAG